MAPCHPPVPGSLPLVGVGVGKRFGSAVALEGVDLVVRRGAVVGLVGPNGSGKTTLLRAAAGLVEIGAGSITVTGQPAGSRSARVATALVPDEPSGFDELTIREFLNLVGSLWGVGERAELRARSLTSIFGLEGRLGQQLGTLSRGLRRQASIVAAFSLATPLVLVDEATATLDPEAVVVLSEAVGALAAGGCGVLVATQDLHFADAVCDEIVLLHRGRVVGHGDPAALRERYNASSLEEVFLSALGEGGLRSRVRDELRAL